MDKEKSGYVVRFANYSSYVRAEYKPDLGSPNTGKVVIQQQDGQKLTIYDVKWVEWTVLRIHAQDMEVDDLKKSHRFSCS